MRSRSKIAAGGLILGCCALIAVGALELKTAPSPDPASLLPEGALLSIQAKDFGSLLHDWNNSEEKRSWIQGGNFQSFSRSRLYERLSQAQDEFSTVATVAPDATLLESVAGQESCLGVYDIGKLEFVYITRMNAAKIESTPLWLVRNKFEHRSEAGSDFYVRKDSASSRTAAFASRGGWLILGTREDLVAGVLDRLAGKDEHNLAAESWYAEAVKQAGEPGELRMTLNLAKIVPSPYFRSYWIQRNITEMKEYSSAVSDLRREGAVYREERVLLRREATVAGAQADVKSVAALVPDDSVLSLAQSSPDPEQTLNVLKEELLERRAKGATSSQTEAPAIATGENAGSASQLDAAIDQAPAKIVQADPFQSLRTLLAAARPVAMMRCYSTGPAEGGVFVSLHTAVALEAHDDWNSQAVQNALTAALAPRLTVGEMGVRWNKRTTAAGDSLALNGAVELFLKSEGKFLLLATDQELLEKMLSRLHKAGAAAGGEAVTYSAAFHPSQEQSNYMQLMRQLDHAGRGQENGGNGDAPSFFAGNIGSLSQAFARLDSEQIDERDNGSLVRQTVTYRWRQ